MVYVNAYVFWVFKRLDNNWVNILQLGAIYYPFSYFLGVL